MVFLCEECRLYPGVAFVENVVVCESCFMDIFGLPCSSVTEAKYCSQCETRFIPPHYCDAVTYDAKELLAALPVRES